jgi:hypothetical protein
MTQRRSFLIALLLYILLAVASFYPQSARPWDTVAYIGDSLESVYILGWDVHQFFRDPRHLFDANILYPHSASLAFNDHRLIPSLLGAPVVWLSGNPILAYNIVLGLACVFAAMSGRYLARRLGLDEISSWAAGALYAFHTYQINEGPRHNVVFHGFFPLVIDRLIVFFKTGEKRQAFYAAGWMLLQAYSTNYYLLYGCLLTVLVAFCWLLGRPRTTVRRLHVLALAGIVAGLVYLPMVIPYISHAEVHQWVREPPVGIDLEHYVSTTPTNLIYGSMGTEVRLQIRGPHFVGFFSLALAALALGVWILGRDEVETKSPSLSARCWVPFAALIAALLISLSLGREAVLFGRHIGPGPYMALYHWVPGFDLVRIPERFSLLAMLFIALLTSRGLMIVRKISKSRYVALLLAALIPLEHLSPLPMTQRMPVGDEVPAVYRWLHGEDTGAVAEVPIRGEGLIRKESIEMYFSLFHWKPIIHGYTSYPPILTRILRLMAEEFPSETSLQVLQRVGVDTVVVHHGRAEGSELYRELPTAVTAGHLRQLAEFHGAAAHVYEGDRDEVYRIVSLPKWNAAPMPNGGSYSHSTWRYSATRGDATRATDGDLTTAWEVTRPLVGDESFDIRFERSTTVSGMVMRLRNNSYFPTRFRIVGRDSEGRAIRLARFDEEHALQVVDQLLENPGHAILGFDFEDLELTSLSIRIGEGGTKWDRLPFPGWSVPEIEVWVP